MTIAIACNPNVGKTSLFNVLTGSRHSVGNYPGVTVERRFGKLAPRFGGETLVFVDLPGTYSLTVSSEDEAVAFRALTGADDQTLGTVLLVLDASNLARNLYLAFQVLELGVPTVVALNMVDVAERADLAVDSAALAKALGVAVVPTNARTGEGVAALLEALRTASSAPAPQPLQPGADATAWRDSAAMLDNVADAVRGRWLIAAIATGQLELARPSEDERIALADLELDTAMRATSQIVTARYQRVDKILGQLGYAEKIRGTAPAMSASARIDKVLTHRIWGLVAFVGVMSVVFVAIFSWADPVMGLIEFAVGWLGQQVANGLGPGLFTDLLKDGVISGVGNVLVFVPQIALLFLFLGLLEDSGYLARAAFLLDRLMSRLGLHGRAFIPLLSGYACSIPAIMSTRTISNVKDRMVTILMIPYMSCSARLPIYALVIGALFVSTDPWISDGVDRGLILLAMYALSTVSALAMGYLYKRTILVSPTPPLVLELPPYRMPRLGNTLLVVYDKTKAFVRDAGTVILAFTIVLWAVLSFPRDATGAGGEGPTRVADSYGGRAAQLMEPALKPIGQDWRIGVGILASFAAREVMVSSLGLVYGMEADEDDPVELRRALREDVDEATGKKRHTPLSGLALMVFFVYACQCMSTLAVVKRETGGWKWPAFMFFSMTAIAYVAALLVFQIGRLLGYG